MNKMLLGIGVVVIAALALFVFFTPKESTPSLPEENVSVTNTPAIDLGRGGSSYLDKNGVYSLLYPNEFTLDEGDPAHIRIYKRGESQRPQSEMTDGVLLVFESVDLAGKPLESWVDERLKEATADGTSEIVEPKEMITQNTYPGFRYALRGLGVSQNIVLQKEKNSTNAVLVTYSIDDPQQKGYQTEADAVISSIKLLK